jgi:hypothetical protein
MTALRNSLIVAPVSIPTANAAGTTLEPGWPAPSTVSSQSRAFQSPAFTNAASVGEQRLPPMTGLPSGTAGAALK